MILAERRHSANLFRTARATCRIAAWASRRLHFLTDVRKSPTDDESDYPGPEDDERILTTEAHGGSAQPVPAGVPAESAAGGGGRTGGRSGPPAKAPPIEKTGCARVEPALEAHRLATEEITGNPL